MCSLNRAEEFGLSFAKLINTVVRNVHTTADQLQLKSHISFQGETKQLPAFSHKVTKLDTSRRLETPILRNSNPGHAKSFDDLGFYVGQATNRSSGGLTCLFPQQHIRHLRP
jgi:hypothetical protein